MQLTTPSADAIPRSNSPSSPSPSASSPPPDPQPSPPLPPRRVSRIDFMDGLKLPRDWHPSQPLPEPQESNYQRRLRGEQARLTIPPELTDPLITAYFEPGRSIHQIATDFDLVIPALVRFFQSPPIAAIITSIRDFNREREQVLCAESALTALDTLNRCCTAQHNENPHDPKSTPATRARAHESARKAAANILRRSPPPPL